MLGSLAQMESGHFLWMKFKTFLGRHITISHVPFSHPNGWKHPNVAAVCTPSNRFSLLLEACNVWGLVRDGGGKGHTNDRTAATCRWQVEQVKNTT